MATTFPDGFLWGTATSAHQVEGGNVNSDFWVLEHTPGTPFQEPSGDACDHYHRYPEDIATLAKLGFNTYRFSVEWARVEPEQGEVSLAALEHYRQVLVTCHEHGMTPIVTFHHFTSPRWGALAGGAVGLVGVALARVNYARLAGLFERALDGLALANRAFADGRALFSYEAVQVGLLAGLGIIRNRHNGSQ